MVRPAGRENARGMLAAGVLLSSPLVVGGAFDNRGQP
jgi:hypothetical protein